MTEIKQVVVPDLGGAHDVDVIAILVKVDDEVAVDDGLLTLESEKASMDVPAPFAGKVKAIQIKVGDKVSPGDVILDLEISQATAGATVKEKPVINETKSTTSQIQDLRIPDLGGAHDVDVIAILVKVGDEVAMDDGLLTLESEKASMDVPAQVAGKIKALQVKVGDKVNVGEVFGSIERVETAPSKAVPTPSVMPQPTKIEKPAEIKSAVLAAVATKTTSLVHAGPAVRRLANELGVDLVKVKGSGQKGRIIIQDVNQFVKSVMQQAETGAGFGLQVAKAPKIDFAKFGEIETKPLNKIKRLTGVNVHRSWVTAPHVTQFNEADITDMENYRQQQKAQAAKQGIKLTPIVFVMKAVVAALKQFPQFNSSLDQTGENLIYKKYFHLGVAVDTPNGLVVPVIREVDRKGCFELADELAKISEKARDKGLGLNEMQGGCFTISSLGGIGGTYFTPIINSPDVAILGLSQSQMKPIYKNGMFVPRLMLPMSLSYDHRVIDGADGARFVVYLAERLADIRTLLM